MSLRTAQLHLCAPGGSVLLFHFNQPTRGCHWQVAGSSGTFQPIRSRHSQDMIYDAIIRGITKLNTKQSFIRQGHVTSAPRWLLWGKYFIKMWILRERVLNWLHTLKMENEQASSSVGWKRKYMKIENRGWAIGNKLRWAGPSSAQLENGLCWSWCWA